MEYPVKKWAAVVDIVSGKNQKGVESADGDYPIYGSGGVIGRANAYLCEAGTTIVGRKGTINRPIFINERFWNVDTAFGLSPRQELLPKFLFYYCQSFNFKALDKSTTIPSLAKRDLLNIEMPVPPIPEQERIVARIEELFSQLDASVNELKTAKERLKVYRQAVLKEAFSGITTTIKLNDILIQKPRNGYSPKGVKYETPYRNLTLTATTSGKFLDGHFKYVELDIDEKSYLWVKHNDFLIQRANTAEYVGTTVLYEGIDNYYVYPDLMMKFRVAEEINPRFIAYQMQTTLVRRYFQDHATGTAGSMPKINQATVMNTPIFIADHSLQDKIVEKIEKHLPICDSIEKTVDTALQQAEALRQSILKKAFERKC